MSLKEHRRLNTVAAVGNYLPRRCGIATFTTDLCEALADEMGERGQIFALAMNDVPEGYRYPDRVRMEIMANIAGDYSVAAEFLNINLIDIVLLQHEFGIFGGPAGANILRLLQKLWVPVVTILHSVLQEPAAEYRKVMDGIIRDSERLVVMSTQAVDILAEVYGAPREKVVFIPHGIPDIPFVDPNFYKDQFGVEGRKVILTFGLLSPGKGIEDMIEAMPEIIRRHPDAVYIVLGATHPQLKRRSGEEYRQRLLLQVNQLKLQKHVIFLDRFVSQKELCEYLGAADVYVTPYLNKDQIVSGTLAYAMGAGKAVVSTPYWYAREMLAENRGYLVPFRDPAALAEQVIYLFDHESERHAMRKRAYQFCRNMIWKQVARDYLEVFHKVIAERETHPHPVSDLTRRMSELELPEVDLQHLRTLTDETGILQHATFATPDRQHGYCTDDNARALIVIAMHYSLYEDKDVLPLMQTYLAFLNSAFNEKTGRFRNFSSYDRRWLEEAGSEDSQGRALWALGIAVAYAPNNSILGLCSRLFYNALPAVEELSSPRAWAFVLVGIHAYLRKFGGDAGVKRYREMLARRLQKLFDNHATKDWPWCEDIVAYDNARLPQALLLSGQWLPDPSMVTTGLKALDWLLKVQTGEEGEIFIIGNSGWLKRGEPMAMFDQQPIEAMALLEACLEAYHVTRKKRWLEQARRCLDWFLGRNILRVQLYDFTTGGCRDGLHPNGASENQGAESTLAWLIAVLSMHNIYNEELIIASVREAQNGNRK